MGPTRPANRLEIVRDGRGWAVRKPGKPLPESQHAFLQAAERAAQRLLSTAGGGELRFRDPDGVVRDIEFVAAA